MKFIYDKFFFPPCTRARVLACADNARKLTLSTRRGRSRMISASLNCSFKLSSRRLASRCFRSVCLVFIPIVFPSQSPSRDVESATLIGRRNRTYNTHMHTFSDDELARSFSRLSPNNDSPSREAYLLVSLARASRRIQRIPRAFALLARGKRNDRQAASLPPSEG